MISEEVRHFILSQHREGVKCTDICKNVKFLCSSRTVTRVLNGTCGRTSMKKKRGPKSKVNKKMENRIVSRLTIRRTRWTIGSVAKHEKISERTVARVLEKRGIKVYKKVKRNLITSLEKERRKSFCRYFRKTFKTSDLPRMIWVDECYVVVGEYFNHQNERCYGKSFELIPDSRKFRTFPKTPFSAMIFTAVWSNGRNDLAVLQVDLK